MLWWHETRVEGSADDLITAPRRHYSVVVVTLRAPPDAVYCTGLLGFRGLSGQIHGTAGHLVGTKGVMHGRLGLAVARPGLP